MNLNPLCSVFHATLTRALHIVIEIVFWCFNGWIWILNLLLEVNYQVLKLKTLLIFESSIGSRNDLFIECDQTTGVWCYKEAEETGLRASCAVRADKQAGRRAGDWAYPRFPASGWSRRSVTASRLGTVGRHRGLWSGQKRTRGRVESTARQGIRLWTGD